MHLDSLRQVLDSGAEANPLFQTWGLRDFERGRQNLMHLDTALGRERLRELMPLLGRFLPRGPDPDMALNNLERFLSGENGGSRVAPLIEGRARTLEILLQLFGTSQSFSDVLIANPDFLDMLRVPLRRSPSPIELRNQLQSEVTSREDSAVLRAFRRFRQRQVLRIGTNDVIRERPLEEITRDLSRMAEASLEVALATALTNISQRFGVPYGESGQPARCAVLAFGKLGGEELNYSSDIDLMFIYDTEGATRGKRITGIDNVEFYGRVVTEVVRLLSSHTDRGQAFRIDLRLRPEGQRGPLARSLSSTLSYYDTLGRTWERQALIKLRPVAGDLALGHEFLHAIEPFVYRKYLSFAEINEIKALKRQIEQKAGRAGDTDVKTGHGGIRDIEFTVQFLQLLNGGDLPDVRQRTTLLALEALQRVGCLTDQETQILDDAYRFLRKVEHRLQILFDLQTHRLPEGADELGRLARRMGYPEEEEGGARAAFLRDHRARTDLDRKILNHLLHEAFPSESGAAEPESDLILDPNPDLETIRSALEPHGFRDPQGAYQNLSQLACEDVPFLSTRRCRHFLASIAPRLLGALAKTPNPDHALVNLEKVSASLGGKGVLWELFSFNPPSLTLYVELCSGSEFLSEILIRNPGMVDELLDSLVLNRPRTLAELRTELAELCRGASDIDPILHSFKDKELLRIGVRDILNKEPITATTEALSDLAEALLGQIVASQVQEVERRYGQPLLTEGSQAGHVCRFVVLGLGKLGGRELNYHSDLDLILVYEGDGRTGTLPTASRFEIFESTDTFHYYSELARRIIRATATPGPVGRLYQVDMRLRPMGKSGSLVIPLAEFQRYYATGGGAQLWERQSLTRARWVAGDPSFAPQVMVAVNQAAYGIPWTADMAAEIAEMRARLEASRSERDVKRGFGGTVDIEFLVQLLLLKFGGSDPELRSANIWEALHRLHRGGRLSDEELADLHGSYTFLRMVESRLRIAYNRSLDELPEAPEMVEQLGRRLGFAHLPAWGAGTQFLGELDRHTSRTRELFLRLILREKEPVSSS